MKHLRTVLCFAFYMGMLCAFAQVSPDCSNAVPICNDTPVNGGTNGFGIDDFNGSQASGCLEETITGAIESNSGWYRFRTGASGQLGFNISTNTTEDWDYALYRASDCNNLGEPIRCNFFDNQDQNAFLGVGEDPTGDTDNIQYEDWLQVTPGEDYYLLINNFSNSNSGFSIQFSGQIFVTDPNTALDCSIISNLLGPPISACEGTDVTLDATTTDAVTYNWYQDTGSGYILVPGENDATLVVTSSANYRVEVITVTNNNIISDVQVGFSIVPTAFPVADDAACSEQTTFDLSLKDSEVLGSQSPNEFVVSYHSSLADATSGNTFLPKQYTMQSGSQPIYVRVTSAVNADCFDVSQVFELTNVETPILDFPEEEFLCDGSASISIGSLSTLPNHTYSWDSGETTPSINVSIAGSYILTITNTQAGISCSNTSIITLVVGTPPVIVDIEIEDLQSNNTVTIVADREGDWEYQLDDGDYQLENTFSNVVAGAHRVTINDPRGCGSVSEEIIVVGFPKFFTPNGDGMHDYWHIEGISNLDNAEIFIYDRYGKLVQQLRENSIGWDGTLGGQQLPSTDYWFKLTYTDTNGIEITAKYINNHFSLRR